jgi:hypothetical protein
MRERDRREIAEIWRQKVEAEYDRLCLMAMLARHQGAGALVICAIGIDDPEEADFSAMMIDYRPTHEVVDLARLGDFEDPEQRMKLENWIIDASGKCAPPDELFVLLLGGGAALAFLRLQRLDDSPLTAARITRN